MPGVGGYVSAFSRFISNAIGGLTTVVVVVVITITNNNNNNHIITIAVGRDDKIRVRTSHVYNVGNILLLLLYSRVGGSLGTSESSGGAAFVTASRRQFPVYIYIYTHVCTRAAGIRFVINGRKNDGCT